VIIIPEDEEDDDLVDYYENVEEGGDVEEESSEEAKYEDMDEEKLAEAIEGEVEQKVEGEKREEKIEELKKEKEKKVRAEKELEEVKGGGIIGGATTILSKGAQKIGGGVKKAGEGVKKLTSKEKKDLEGNVPEGKKISSLTDLQQLYFAETGNWPKQNDQLTRSYVRWKQKRNQGGGGSDPGSFVGGDGFQKSPFTLSRTGRRSGAYSPISSGRPDIPRSPIASRKDSMERVSRPPITFGKSGKGGVRSLFMNPDKGSSGSHSNIFSRGKSDSDSDSIFDF